MPHKNGVVEMRFDFIEHVLQIQTSLGESERIRLSPRSVADFYSEFMSVLQPLGIDAKVWSMPGDNFVYEGTAKNGARLTPIPYKPTDLHRQWKSFDIHHDLTTKGIQQFVADTKAR
jgi:hypothetical protein